MNMAITMIDPTASKAATAAIADTTTSASPSRVTGMPMVRANPSSKVEIAKGRQSAAMNSATKAATTAMRVSSGGSQASA